MVELLLADGDDVSDNVRVRIPTRSQEVGDDARSPAGGDEKKIMAEVLDRSVDVCRKSEGSEAAGNFRITARGITEDAKLSRVLVKTAGPKIMRKILSSRKSFMIYDGVFPCSRELTGGY